MMPTTFPMLPVLAPVERLSARVIRLLGGNAGKVRPTLSIMKRNWR